MSRRDWGEFALLLIDVQRSFWPESRTSDFPDFAANVERLLGLCRAEGLDVVHLRALFAPDMADWMVRYKLGGYIPCVAGTPGSETLPYAHERPGETVIIKHTFDGFQNPALAEHLRRAGKRYILTAGLVTSTCVLFTTAAAMQNGFLVSMIEDCCADDLAAHDSTLSHYPFIFDRVTLDRIPAAHPGWRAELAALDRLAEAQQNQR
ncbi:MAG TPA: isochorismatase family cysteine hydrolase [Herpetosiphonaceae bacterium]|nr:isochorismatase family cysteine hydrolase [Herpetosiphonaceae bacterium]